MWTLKVLYPPPSSRALKPEAEVGEDRVVRHSGPEEGEEVGLGKALEQMEGWKGQVNLPSLFF